MIRSGVSLSQEIVPIDENTVANARIRNPGLTAGADTAGSAGAAVKLGATQAEIIVSGPGGVVTRRRAVEVETPDTRC
jgi:hypothetical protein